MPKQLEKDTIRNILRLRKTHKTMGEIANKLGISAITVSKYLKTAKPKQVIEVRKQNETPTFIIHFWDVSKQKLSSRGHDVGSMALSKRFAKHYFEGTITHAQSGDSRIFHGLSEFHAFIEKHRL